MAQQVRQRVAMKKNDTRNANTRQHLRYIYALRIIVTLLFSHGQLQEKSPSIQTPTKLKAVNVCRIIYKGTT